MLTRLAILASIVAVLSQTAQAQLSKSQHSAVVHLTAPGKCTGSGFFVSAHYILTASHVAQTVKLDVLINGKRHQCTVTKRNDFLDYALLHITTYSCKNPIKLAAPVVGETVYGYGFPGDSKKLNKNYGVVAIDAIIGAWQYSGEAQMGMSGGPVINSRGQAVGITTNMGRFGQTIFRSTEETRFAPF